MCVINLEFLSAMSFFFVGGSDWCTAVRACQ